MNTLEGKHANDELHNQDRQGLCEELPGQILRAHQQHEDTKHEGVVHNGRAQQGRETDANARTSLLLCIVIRRHQLTCIARHRRQHKGNVERRNARTHANLTQHVDHRVGDDDHNRRAETHHTQTAELDPALLLLRGEGLEVVGDFVLFFIFGLFATLHVPAREIGHATQAVRLAILARADLLIGQNKLAHALHKLVIVDRAVLVRIELVEKISNFLAGQLLAHVLKQHTELLDLQTVRVIGIVHAEERTQNLAQTLHVTVAKVRWVGRTGRETGGLVGRAHFVVRRGGAILKTLTKLGFVLCQHDTQQGDFLGSDGLGNVFISGLVLQSVRRATVAVLQGHVAYKEENT
mmetsp:Transcript_35920/g.61853  ORF Transcript_35920/g.61853 Transcript_35920/m.61853 type:complete len:350 (+) Transcript_35920:634-1683(+)